MRKCGLAVLLAISAATSVLSQGYSPQDAMKHVATAKGLRVTMFASEPEVRQPIFVKCDDRGRLWTIQYLQYPNPAGLERVKVDRWSRTIYDRVPEPPPHGPRGADKITILEDTNGDGQADRFKEFVDALNLATGVEFGYGGVFVLNVPYLLFYPDKDRNDVPDADPEVLLSGFGMEDAQSFSNHLTWGPDGWLYGVNGSTTTCRIRGIEFQQGLWRYHPVTREFELFCEGGSNCYGVTFDANGECYYSTNAGPFVQAVQGGYFYKSFGKHGPLHNLFAYHYFPEQERDQVPGGPPTGGTIYLADAFPAEMRGSFIAGNFLGHTVSWWTLSSSGSTVRATYGGEILNTHDTWSGPTDVCLAPDGSLYVCDFYDQRTSHPDPDANWDRSNGRIYKISAERAKPATVIDVVACSTNELIDLLTHANHWYATRARMELARRRDPDAVAKLRDLALQSDDTRAALEGLWALHAVGGFDDRVALELFEHPYPYVRYWAVRFVGDAKAASIDVGNALRELATREKSAAVRAQLAASAKRLPAGQGLPIVEALLRSNPEESDPRVPWLIWWAIESKAVSDADQLVAMFSASEMWANDAGRENVLRLIRRFAAEGTQLGYDACEKLLQSVPGEQRTAALHSLRQGLAERAVALPEVGQGALFDELAAESGDSAGSTVRHYEPLAGPLKEYVEEIWRVDSDDELILEIAVRANVAGARDALLAAAFDSKLAPDHRVPLLHLVREFGDSDVANKLVSVVLAEGPEAVRAAALDALSNCGDEAAMQLLHAGHGNLSPAMQSRVRDVLISQRSAALRFLQDVDAGFIPASDMSMNQLRQLALHEDDEIDSLVRKHWGNIGPGTAEEKLATMRRFNNDIRNGSGDAVRGKVLFAKHCGVCHQLNGEGNKVGPDLTTANRHDLAALLGNIVDPSAVVRREYMAYVLTTTSGRVHSGLLAEQDGASVTILDANNQRIQIPRDEIDSLEESEVSLMPERILDGLSPQEICDLFTYIQGAPAT